MNLTAGLAACALATGMTLTGCSVGQVSQTATQAPAVNGTGATVGDITLRNVHLRAAQTIDYVQPGRNVELLLVASNGSPEDDDKLVSISSDVGARGWGTRRRHSRRADHAPGVGRGRRRRRSLRCACQTHHQRPDLQLHLHFRASRPDRSRGADIGR